jgi:hypothetical protein
MERVVGIFQSVDSAERAVEDLLGAGMSAQSIILLSNQKPRTEGVRTASPGNLDNLPTAKRDESQEHEAGKSMGTAVGAATGATVGATVASTVAALLVPGVGTVWAIGMGAAALLGLGGAAAGSKLADVGADSMNVGVPKEDVQFYQELLRRGRSIVVANADSEDRANKARQIFQQRGSEDVTKARQELREAA